MKGSTEQSERAEFQATMRQLEEMLSELDQLSEPILSRLNEFLKAMEGKSFSSRDENRSFAAVIRHFAERLGCETECPYCSKAGYFSSQKHNEGKGQYVNGGFLFQHRQVPNTSHGGRPTIPKVRLNRTLRRNLP